MRDLSSQLLPYNHIMLHALTLLLLALIEICLVGTHIEDRAHTRRTEKCDIKVAILQNRAVLNG